MKLIHISLVVIMLCVSQTVAAQTSDIDDRSHEIIEACIDAMGTEMRLRGVNTLSLRGTTRLVQQEESGEPIVIVVSGDDQFHMSQGNGKIFTAFFGDEGWTGIDGQPPRRLVAAQVHVVREFLPLPHVVVGWSSFPGTVRFVGASEVGGRSAWKLEFTHDPSGLKFTRDFDQESKLLVRQKFADSVSVFEFVKMNDVAILSKWEVYEGPGTAPGEVYQEFQFDEINVNEPVAEDLFRAPDDLQDAIKDEEQSDG